MASTVEARAFKLTPRLVGEVLREKQRLRDRIASKLSEEERREALRDSHARRRPIPCGMTIHTGIGCRLGCLYCYVPDMGFPMKPRPYPLTGLQLVYALLSNPYFIPGPAGTLLAFGSVTEPFLEETRERALEYLEATWRWLRNPQQISTKVPLWGEWLDRFLEASDPRISVLVSMSTLRYARVLEPAAPSPEERLEWIRTLSEKGVHVTLFLRPIIPGVTEKELDEIMRRAAEAKARAVIVGSLRVTPGILRRLEASGVVPVEELRRRLPRQPRDSRDQVTLKMTDLKRLAAEAARRHGLRVLPSSCSANIESHGLSCWACHWGPCGDPRRLPALDEDTAAQVLEALGCTRVRGVRVTANTVSARCRHGGGRRGLDRVAVIVETLAKRRVLLRPL